MFSSMIHNGNISHLTTGDGWVVVRIITPKTALGW